MATSLFAAPLYVPRHYEFDANGNPLSGGKVFSFAAGTSTPLATYPTYADALAGTNANANPVILDSAGSASIFLQAALYKITVQDSTGVQQYSVDSVGPALAFPSPYPTEWTVESSTATFVSATSFKFVGVDKSTTYHVGRRVRTTNTGGTVYSTVTAVSFASDTTVTVVNDSGTVDSGLSAVAYGFNSYTNPSYLDPRTLFLATKSGNQAASFATSTKIATWTVVKDALAEWDNANNRWVAKYPGDYIITASVACFDTVTATSQLVAQIYKSGTINAAAQLNLATVSVPITPVVQTRLTLTAGQYIEVFIQALTGTAGTVVAQVTAVPATTLTITRVA